MQNNLFQIFDTIFLEQPKPPKSIFLEIDILNNQNTHDPSTKVSDIFEIFLNMLIYGFKKLNLDFTPDNILILQRYFNSVGVKLNIEYELFDTILFKDPRYVNRYCLIDQIDFTFIMNVFQKPRNNLHEFIATYQLDYEYLLFIQFEYI